MSEADGQTKQPADLEQRLLDAATRLFAHYGYDKTTMNDIAREAGAAKSTIYLHWGTKDNLFGAVLWRESRRYLAAWTEMVEADPQGGTFHGLFKNVILALRQSAFMMAVFNQDRRVIGSYLQGRDSRGLYLQRFTMGKAFLSALQKAGAVRADVDIDAVACISSCLRYGLMNLDEFVPADQMPPFDRVVEVMVEMLERMLTPDGGGNSDIGKQIIRQMMGEFQKHIDDVERHLMSNE